ncbi:MAG: Nudix family hydrolase [Zoogloeaceae bacterium]|jgi:8-oxo-dGTP diphosphatase|nr:Nudix family hydrolase [Zoogloeaceae bacterium]
MRSAPITEVVAAVLLRGREFLLACRPQGKVCAGYWEFPGGKVEADESAHAALVRELWEELGIAVTHASPWLTRQFVYPHAHVRIQFWRVTQWRGIIGETGPLEPAAVCWQPLAGPVTVAPVLPANVPILKALTLPVVMAITHAEAIGPAAERARLLRALEYNANGIILQLRDRGLPSAGRRAWAETAQALSARHHSLFLISEDGNGEGETLARQLGASGVHLTAAALARCGARPDFPWAGASCHTREELEHAARLALDYALLGPMLPTPSHPEQAGLGWTMFAHLVENLGLPVFALGGQSIATLEKAQEHGAHGIASLRDPLCPPATDNHHPHAPVLNCRLQDRFAALLRACCADALLCERLVAELLAAYSEEGRHYHTLAHLDFMLAEFDAIRADIRDPDAMLFALFYHDVVYIPGRTDNEAQSAEFAAVRLERLGLSPPEIGKVRDLILATAGHMGSDDPDTNLFLDLDLAALGVPRPRYLEMATLVRMEYPAYDEAHYTAGRLHFLDGFLSRSRIFQTPRFHSRYEALARANLAYERDVLRAANPANGFWTDG